MYTDAKPFLMRMLNSFAAGGLIFTVIILAGSRTIAQQITLLDITQSHWTYLEDGSNQGTAWTGKNFSDGSWQVGFGLFGVETTPQIYPYPFQTPLRATSAGGPITTYFRAHFQWVQATNNVVLTASNYIDDGAVFYLNGVEVGRLRVATNQTYTTFADNQLNEGQVEVLNLPAATLVQGDNVLAVEVHQTSLSSSDVVWGMALVGAIAPPPVITGFSPASGPAGTTLTISGANFSAIPASNIVFFGAVRAAVTAAATTSLTVTVPSGATYTPITVTRNGLTGYSPTPFTLTFDSSYGVTTSSFAPAVFVTNANFLPVSDPARVAAGDFDGDGKVDLAVAGWNPFLHIYQNTGTGQSLTPGSFVPRIALTVNDGQLGLQVADVDGDGKLDLVVSTLSAKRVSVFRNTSTGGVIDTNSFAPRVDFAVANSIVSVAVRDLDGDGKPDLIVANQSTNTISVLRNRSVPGALDTNSFAPEVQFSCGANPQRFAVGDLDGDGKPDLAVATPGALSVSLFRNLSTVGVIDSNSFSPRINLVVTQAFDVATADFDGDGRADLAVSTTMGKISVFRNTATNGTLDGNSFSPNVDFAMSSSLEQFAVADLDGDGKPDLVSASGAGTSLYRNTATPGAITPTSFAARVDIPLAPSSVAGAIADFDGDGKPDLASGLRNSPGYAALMRNVVPPARPLISAQPTNQFVRQGSNATFVVTATGRLPLAYQWRFNGTDIPGATNGNLTVANAQSNNVGSYDVRVANGFGTVTSSVATLTLIFPPVITQQPVSQAVVVGGTVSFSVAATGSVPMGFRWRRGPTTVAFFSGNETNSTLVVTNAQTNATYTVVVTNVANTGGVLSTNAGLTVLPDFDQDRIPDDWEARYGLSSSDPSDAARDSDGDGFSNLAEFVAGTDPTDPSSFPQVSPQVQSVPVGTAVTFSVTASNGAALSYQWRRDGVIIPGANGSSYMFSSAQSSNSGAYDVILSNYSGSAIARAAHLQVNSVGPFNVVIPSGGAFISNPLLASDNRVAAVMVGLPNGISVFKIGPGGYVVNNFLGDWSDSAMTILPGEGFFVSNPTSTGFTVTFAGESVSGTNRLPLGWSLCSSIWAQRGLLERELGFPVAEGDQVFLYGPGNIPVPYSYSADNPGWFPSEPLVEIAQSFFVYKNNTSVDWVQSFGGQRIFVARIQATSPVGQVNFFTYNLDPAKGRVLDSDRVTPLGGAFLGQLYAGTSNSENSLVAVGTPQTFLSSANAGYIRAGAVVIPGTTTQQPVYVQLRVWESARGATYEAAVANGSKYGRSALTTSVVGGSSPPLFPPAMNVFPSFSLFGPPAITSQPQSQTAECGSDLALQVAANSEPALRYQWTFNRLNLAGQTNSVLTLAKVALNQSGNYQAIVSNSFGSATSEVATVTIVDTRPPSITAPADRIVPSDLDACTASAVSLGTPSTGDSCSVANVSSNAPARFPVGVTPVTWIVTDGSGLTASATQRITVVDNQQPRLSLVPDVTVSWGEPTTPERTGTPTASDNCTGVSLTFADQTIQAVPPIVATIRRTWTAIDVSGNSAFFTQTISQRDSTAPTLTCPPPQTKEWPGPSGATVAPVTYPPPTVRDDCDTNPRATCSPVSGSNFPLGATTVTCTATDASGNSSSCSFTVTLQDTTPPKLCTSPPLVRTDGSFGGQPVPATPRPELANALHIETPLSFGEPTHGQFIHSFDGLPECTTEATLRLGLKPGPGFSIDDTISVGFADSQGFHPVLTRTIGQSQTNGESGLVSRPWIGEGAEIELNMARLPVSNSSRFDAIPQLVRQPFIDIYVADDTIVDYARLEYGACRCMPEIKAFNQPGRPDTPVTFATPTFTDNCDPNPRVAATPGSGSIFTIGRTPVEITATDSSGNVGRCWFTVNVCDNEPPKIHCPPKVDLLCAKPTGAPVFFHVTATDNTGVANVQCQPPSGSVFALGATTVQCVAQDTNGLTDTCSFPVKVQGNIAPSIALTDHQGSDFLLSFDTQQGLQYAVEFKHSVMDPAWEQLTALVGTGLRFTVRDPMGTQQRRFYRTVLLNPPLPGASDELFEPPEPPPAAPGTSEPCRPDCQQPSVPYVYLFDGELHYETEDLRIRGRGLDLIWARKYRHCKWVLTPLGYGWVHSYDICIVPNGPHIDLYDGHTRVDTYFRQSDGSYLANQFFREGRFVAGRWVLKFADGGTWEFRPLDGTPAQGRIDVIQDRNNNALHFFYNSSGQLVRINDTLNRDILIAYNFDGFIETVTDFTGRQVRYDYYRPSDADGGFGDLKLAVSPIVTNTPHANDFPEGKTNVYTYTKCYDDPVQNHDLLTIMDGKGQVWLQSVYEPPLPGRCNRVIIQHWGYTNQTLHYTYVDQTPSTDNNFAIIKAIVNDRVGNVNEYFFDAGNRCVLHRAYTGRAITGDFTTDTQNRPRNKLRSSDPAWFETRFEWNIDSMPTRVIWPNGNRSEYVWERDINFATPARSRGNLRVCRQVSGPLGGDQPVIEESFDYATDRGGCCAENFVTRHTDARGHVTLHFYDANGNRLRTQHRIPTITEDFGYNQFGQLTARVWPDNGSGYRRRDVFVHYDSGLQRGYLAQEIVDAEGLALTTTYERDAVGNVIRKVDPRGHDTLYTINALNQPVREISREVSDSSSIRYEKLIWYDANNNVVRVDLENRDEQGARPAENTHFSTITEYEILNKPVRVISEKGTVNLGNTELTLDAIRHRALSEFVLKEFAYDANRNLALTRHGEAVAGHDPFNVEERRYDERDLLFRTIRGPGSQVQSTDQFDYDGNKNLKRVSQGLEDAPRVTVRIHDGYNRPARITDPMGNISFYHYDPNHNAVAQRSDGELVDLPGSAGNIRLQEIFRRYDEMDRLVEVDQAHFDQATQQPYGDGFSSKVISYSDNSQVVQVTDDRGNHTLTRYDTVNRPSVIIDARGNAITNFHDVNGNVIATVEVDKSDLGTPDQIFVTRHSYDNLDRLIQTIDNLGGTNRLAYDSSHNRVRHTNARGHAVRFVYDGLSRLTRTIRDMDGNGPDPQSQPGDGNPDIVTSQIWDDSDRLIAETDDNGHTTRKAYDAVDRCIITRFADGTVDLVGIGTVNWPDGLDRPTLTEEFINGYDVHDNAWARTRQNGVVVRDTYDLLNRPANRSMNGSGGPTFESRFFTGCSQLAVAQNDFSLVTFNYDSLCNRIRETCNLSPPNFPTNTNRVTTAVYDGVGNELLRTYPGGRVVGRSYDVLNRLAQVCNGPCGGVLPPGALIAEYSYLGRDRVEGLRLGNGTVRQVAYDGLRRVTAASYIKTGPPAITLDQRTYRWDAAGNKTNRSDVRLGGPGLQYRYAYDAADRLTNSFASSSANPMLLECAYTLDGAGNRTRVSCHQGMGNYTVGLLNQYLVTPFDLGRDYDANGDLLAIRGAAATTSMRYDYGDLLLEGRPGPTAFIGYVRDALGRRVQKLVGVNATRFLFGAGAELEEQDSAGNTLATYVYGRQPDELLRMRRGGSDYFYHADDLGNVMAVSDSAGTVVERYEYGDYGQPFIATDTLGMFAASAIGNPRLFAGHRFEPETRWYDFGERYLDPLTGRFLTPDPNGPWREPARLGNAYTYHANNPWCQRLRVSGARCQVSRCQESGPAAVPGLHLTPGTGTPDSDFYWDPIYASWFWQRGLGCTPVQCDGSSRRTLHLIPPGCICCPISGGHQFSGKLPKKKGPVGGEELF